MPLTQSAYFERTEVKRKLPFLGERKASKEVMKELDDLGHVPYKPRVRKDPGFGLEAFWHVEWTKTGSKVTHRTLDMWRRVYTMAAYKGQQFGFWLMKPRKEVVDKSMQLRKHFSDMKDRAANASDKDEPKKERSAKGAAGSSMSAGRGRSFFGLDFKPVQHENIIGYEKLKSLEPPKRGGLVPAPRLLGRPLDDKRSVEERKLPRRSDAQRLIEKDRIAGYLPAPRPQSKRSPAVDREVGFKRDALRSKGRAAALKAAKERAKEAERRAKKASRSDNQR